MSKENTVVLKMIGVHSKVERLHAEITLLMAETYEAVKSKFSDEDLVDLGFLMKRSAVILDDARKELSAKQQLVDKFVALRVGSAQMKDSNAEGSLRGKMSIATPDVKTCAKLPEPGTPAHSKLLAHFGIDNAEAVKSGIVDLKFSGVSDYLTQLASKGINPPDGLSETFQKISVTYRERKL